MTKKKGPKPEKPNSEIQFKFWLSHFLGVNLDSYPTFWSLHFPVCTVRTSLRCVKSGQLFSEQPVEQASVQGAQGPSGAQANHWN